MTLKKTLLALAMAVGPVAMSAAQQPLATAKDQLLLTDFSGDVARDEQNSTLVMRFKGIRPLAGQGAGDVGVVLEEREGKWLPQGTRAAADYNQVSPGTCEVVELAQAGNTLTGKLHVTISADRPRPNAKEAGFPTPADVFEITFKAEIERGAAAPYENDPEAFMPPWRKDMPRYGGHKVSGTFTASWSQPDPKAKDKAAKVVETKGEVAGGLNAAAVPGKFGGEGNVFFEAKEGLRVLTRLSPKRVAAPEGARVVKNFEKAQDWSKYDAIRITVTSPKRRDDAEVSLGIQEADGSWYGVHGAALLLGREAMFDVPFSDFRRTGGFDENYFLDVDKVGAMSLGADDPRGVGDVEFTVKKVELVRLGEAPYSAGPTTPVTISVEPESRYRYAGAGEIAKGLFGFHDVGQPKSAEVAGAGGVSAIEYMKQLNPGYLRPLDHVGFNAKALSDEEIKAMIAQRVARKDAPGDVRYQRAVAGNAVDEIVWCHTTDLWARPPWMEADLDGFLAGVRAFYRDQAARAWVPGDDFNMLRKVEVWNEPFMWGRHINMGAKTPGGKKNWEDPTQFGYLPAKVGAEIWSRIFLAAVEGAKSANVNLQLGGPSAASFSTDDYSNFTTYMVPILEAVHDKLDFITEHHYEGVPSSYAASYFVVNAYNVTKFGKSIPIYNTEANDLTDIGTKAKEDPVLAGQARNVDWNKAHYNIEDILACILVCPDVAKGRAMHALWSGFCNNAGETDAYTLLSTLRGTRISASSSDGAVMSVAATPAEGKLVVFCFNNSNFERNARLVIPGGFKLAEAKVLVFKAGEGTRIADHELKAGDAGTWNLSLASRSAVRVTLERAGYKPSRSRDVDQAFAPAVLAQIAPDEAVTTVVKQLLHTQTEAVPVKAAYLRVVTRDVQRGEGVVVINGHEVALPWSSSNDGGAVAQDVAIDPAWVAGPEVKLEFKVSDAASFNGYTLCAASVNVER